MKLIATYPILYQAHQYAIGDDLPTYDETMVKAWVETGTAAWVEANTSSSVKAVPVTAPPGLAGESVGVESDVDNLVGIVPKTPSRKKAK